MKKEKKKNKNEDTSMYGEFVCSLDHWLPIEKQKENAERLNEITKNKR